MVERAKKLGIRSELDTTSSVALGASCVRPVEMARAYAAFQRDVIWFGRAASPHVSRNAVLRSRCYYIRSAAIVSRSYEPSTRYDQLALSQESCGAYK